MVCPEPKRQEGGGGEKKVVVANGWEEDCDQRIVSIVALIILLSGPEWEPQSRHLLVKGKQNSGGSKGDIRLWIERNTDLLCEAPDWGICHKRGIVECEWFVL